MRSSIQTRGIALLSRPLSHQKSHVCYTIYIYSPNELSVINPQASATIIQSCSSQISNFHLGTSLLILCFMFCYVMLIYLCLGLFCLKCFPSHVCLGCRVFRFWFLLSLSFVQLVGLSFCWAFSKLGCYLFESMLQLERDSYFMLLC